MVVAMRLGSRRCRPEKKCPINNKAFTYSQIRLLIGLTMNRSRPNYQLYPDLTPALAPMLPPIRRFLTKKSARLMRRRPITRSSNGDLCRAGNDAVTAGSRRNWGSNCYCQTTAAHTRCIAWVSWLALQGWLSLMHSGNGFDQPFQVASLGHDGIHFQLLISRVLAAGQHR